MLAELGIPVVDADQVARDVVEPGEPSFQAIVGEFGPTVVGADGRLDRTALRKLAFSSDEKRRRLEAIVHPAIARRSDELFERHLAGGARTVVYEASLLFEAGRGQDFDGILVVTCDPVQQRARLLARDHTLSPEIADRMIAAQMPQVEKIRRATWVIENSSSSDELRRRVAHWKRMTNS